MHSSKDGRTNFNKSRLEFADDIVVVVVVAKELSHILRQQRQKQLWSCSNSTKLLYGPRTKKASSLYVRTTSKLLSTYLANGWLVAKAVVLGHFLEFSDRQLQLAGPSSYCLLGVLLSLSMPQEASHSSGIRGTLWWKKMFVDVTQRVGTTTLSSSPFRLLLLHSFSMLCYSQLVEEVSALQ